MLFDNPLSAAFGIDIGDRTFKLAQVSSRGWRRKTLALSAWGSVDVPEGVMERGDIKDMDKAVAHLVKLLKSAEGRVTGRATVACLPEAKTFVKIIEVDRDASPEALQKAIHSELEQNIPLPIDDIYYDWQLVERPMNVPVPAKNVPPVVTPALAPASAAPATAAAPAAAPVAASATAPAAPAAPEEPTDPTPAEPMPAEKKYVLLGAAPKKLVDDYIALLEKAGLAPIALDIEAMAIARAIVPDHHGKTADPVGILDIGATRSSLVIVSDGVLRMSISIPISGIAITKMVSDALNVSMDDAERLKRECGLDADRCEDKMWKILLPLIDDMTEKIHNALRFYSIGFPGGKKIEQVFLCGGGALFHEIDTVLSRKLTIQVRRGDALVNVDHHLPKGFVADEALQYATAIGLGLRAAEENRKDRGSLE